MKQCLLNVWCGMSQSIYDGLTDEWRGNLQACVLAKGGHLATFEQHQ